MAHKKVAEVTLNDAGKAATLTLAEGWAFDGSRGPFTLDNVEHGHRIVKGAIADGTAPVTARQRSQRLNTTESVAPAPSRPVPDLERPTKPRGDVIIVYRLMLIPRDESAGDEVSGWLKPSREYTKKELDEWCWSNLARYGRAPDGRPRRLTPETHKPWHKRWTNKDQASARKAEENGSPWASENHGD
jgi:hypothetical protein